MPAQIIEILKEAILLERRGRAFYQQTADQSKSPVVREFFQMMADEEHHHMQILEKQYKAYNIHQQLPDFDEAAAGQKTVVDQVMTDALKAQIAAAGFEAAAISAAMFMEEQAVTLYADRARLSSEPKEKALFRWLAGWEHEHLSYLVALERDIREQVWNNRQFWPF